MEALSYAVPLVCVPFFWDQPQNCVRIGLEGAAVVLHKNYFTALQLSSAIEVRTVACLHPRSSLCLFVIIAMAFLYRRFSA